jgi:hypothetical protein
MKRKKITLVMNDGDRYFKIAQSVPESVQAALESCLKVHSVAWELDDDFNEFIVPSGYKVHFTSCDGDFSHRAVSLEKVAVKIREYIGNAGYVSDDGGCRCVGVTAQVKGMRRTFCEVSLAYILKTFPA